MKIKILLKESNISNKIKQKIKKLLSLSDEKLQEIVMEDYIENNDPTTEEDLKEGLSLIKDAIQDAIEIVAKQLNVSKEELLSDKKPDIKDISSDKKSEIPKPSVRTLADIDEPEDEDISDEEAKKRAALKDLIKMQRAARAKEREKGAPKAYTPPKISVKPEESKEQKQRRLLNVIFSRDTSISDEEKQKAREELYSDPEMAKRVMNSSSSVPEEEKNIAASFYKKSSEYKALSPEEEKSEEERLEKIRADSDYLRKQADFATRKQLEISELKTDPYNLNIDEEELKKVKEKDINKIKEYLSELGYISQGSKDVDNFSKLLTLVADLRAFSLKISTLREITDYNSLSFIKKVLNDKIKEIRTQVDKQKAKSTGPSGKVQLIDIDEKNKEKNMAIAAAARSVKDVIYKVITKDDAISLGLFKPKEPENEIPTEDLTEGIKYLKKQNIFLEYIDLCLESIQKSLFTDVKINVVLSEGKLLLEAEAAEQQDLDEYDSIYIERLIDEDFSSYLNNQKIAKLKKLLNSGVEKFNSIIQTNIPDVAGAEKLSADSRKLFISEAYADILDAVMKYSDIFKKINDIATKTDSTEKKELLKDLEDLKQESATFTSQLLKKTKTINNKPFVMLKNFEGFLSQINSEVYVLTEEAKQALQASTPIDDGGEESEETKQFTNIVNSKYGKFAIAAYERQSNNPVRLASPFLISRMVADLIASRMNANKIYFFITPEIAEKFKITGPSKLPIEKDKPTPELNYGLFILKYDYEATQPPVWMSNKEQLDKIIDSRKFEDARLTINDLSPKEMKALEKEKLAKQKEREISGAKAQRAKEIEAAGGDESQATTEIPPEPAAEVSNVDQIIDIWKSSSFGQDIPEVFQGINLFTKYKPGDKDLEASDQDTPEIKAAKEQEKVKREQKRKQFKEKYEEATSALGEKGKDFSETEKVRAFLQGLSGIRSVSAQKVNDFLDIVGVKRFTRKRGSKNLQEGYYGGRIMIVLKAKKPIVENKVISEQKNEERDLIKERLMRLAGLLE